MAFSANLWKNGIDMHTGILNYIYSLYFKSNGYANLTDIGYWGNPDPHLGAVTPDFISCGTNGDVQIIDVKSFYRDDIKKFEYDCDDVAQKLEKVYEKYNALTPLEILPYLNLHKAERDPKIIEIVFVFPNEVFEGCLPIIKTKVSKNLIIWTFDFSNDPPILRKVLGNHNQQVLEDAVRELVLTPHLEILVRYFRNSDLKDIKWCFSTNLMNSCLQDQKIDFAFDEIDVIMTNLRPPLLGHLSKRKREDFWRRCLRFLVDVAKVIKPSSKGPNYYAWRAGILRSPYYRERTLEKIKEKLGGRRHERT